MNTEPSGLQWATLIPAAIGGLIAGIAGWVAAIAIHKRERQAVQASVATAIYKEMENLLSVLEGLIGKGKIEETRANGIALQLRQFDFYTEVYDNNLDKIGLLGAERAGEFVNFYNTFKFCIAVSKSEFVFTPKAEFLEKVRAVLSNGRAVQGKIAPLVKTSDQS